MNAKKVKLVRKFLRHEGIDPTEVSYLKRNEHVVVAKDISGTVVASVSAHTAYLDPKCGRAIYKQFFKKVI